MALQKELGPIAEQRSLTTIGAVVSSDLITQALILILVGSIGILLWITYRFRDVKFGVTALVALLHDVIVVVGTFAILGTFFHVEIDALFVTAMLTVIGFSVHDTIVVFDRVRENKARHAGEPFADIVNHSILQTFGRSIMTSLTVVLTLLALLLFGGSAISDFILALLIGIISGTYSSIFVAAPLLVDWQLWDDRRHGRLTDDPQPSGPARGILRPPTHPTGRSAVQPSHGILTPWSNPVSAGPFPISSRRPRRRSRSPASAGSRPRLAGLLAARGAVSGEDLIAWFADPLEGLHDPARLPDAAVVLARFRAARDRGERVLVFGDFDADGLTGLAIMTLALRRFGVAVEPYVPSRLDEGHGLSMAALDAAVAGGATVIVTVDCGTTSVAEVAAANARGLDVIVTDHHRVPAVLPAALAIVNPHRPDSTYPDRRLAGSGVAFKVAQLLLADEPGGPGGRPRPDGPRHDRVRRRRRADRRREPGDRPAGPRAAAARPAPRHRGPPRARPDRPGAVDLETVAFAIAPRLNAAGRVGEALEAARLLLAEDPAEAASHADALEAANLTRRDLMKVAVAEARTAVTAMCPGDAATVVRGPWSVGIVGLVAARLAEDRGRPAVVGADLGDVVRASCRSDGVLDLGAALERCADLFTRYGGHAGAAGFELPVERWDAFRERFLALAATAPPDPRVSIAIDLALPAIDVDYALYRELAGLAPCGPGNPDPLVAVLGLTVTRVRAATGGHTQLTLRRERDVLDGIAFGRPDIAEVVREGDRLDVVARLTSRRFGGFESLQLDIRDVATSGESSGDRGGPLAGRRDLGPRR